MPGRYPPYEALADAYVRVAFSDHALRLRWRLVLNCPPLTPAGGPAQFAPNTATAKTAWRVLPAVPGSDGADLTTYVEDDADFASTGLPWSDAHPVAHEPLTDPPVGRIDLRIPYLEDCATEMWPVQHRACFDADVDPDACGCGEPAFRAPGPLRLEPAEGGEGRDFVTVADYVREVGRWMESDAVGRGLATWWPRTDRGGVRDGKAVASGRMDSFAVDEVVLDVQTARYPGSVSRNQRWAMDHKRDVEQKPQWLPQSLAIAESLRRG